jgi:hypothetical protein
MGDIYIDDVRERILDRERAEDFYRRAEGGEGRVTRRKKDGVVRTFRVADNTQVVARDKRYGPGEEFSVAVNDDNVDILIEAEVWLRHGWVTESP